MTTGARGFSPRGLGVAVIILALLALAQSVVPLLPLRFSPSGAGTVGWVVDELTSLLYLGVLFGFWRLTRPREGSSLILAAFVGAVAGLLLEALRGAWVSLSPSGAAAFTWWEYYAGNALAAAVPLLFAIGLLRSRLVRPWIPAVGIAAGLLGVALSALWLLYPDQTLPVSPASPQAANPFYQAGVVGLTLETVLASVFLVGLGVALSLGSLRHARDQRDAPAG